MCVDNVVVKPDGYMEFNIVWGVTLSGRVNRAIKHPDTGNPNMYVTDNLGNRYDHVEVGGAAAELTTLLHTQTAWGWYLFPPARPGATEFAFHDDDQHVQVPGIVLLHPEGE